VTICEGASPVVQGREDVNILVYTLLAGLIAGACTTLFLAARSAYRISAGDRDQIQGGRS
jgi:thiol:disulfide interchange protein